MDFIDHPLIQEDSIERRLYQENILDSIKGSDSLVVIPTGLGKTTVAAMLAAHRLNKHGGSVLFLAPTRPLAEQHKKMFADTLEIAEGDMAVFTGKVRPAQRDKRYGENTVIFATPQVVQNDLISGKLELDDYTLLVLDECHRGTGDYPYEFITEMYNRHADNGRILGITASPGDSKDKIKHLCENLKLENMEIRTEDDDDVRPYIEEVQTEWKEIELPSEFAEVQVLIKEALEKRYDKLRNWDEIGSKQDITKGDLLDLQTELRKKASGPDPDPSIFQAISTVAEALKIEHALVLLETQGISALVKYLKRMKKSAEKGKTKAVKRVMNDARIEAAMLKAYELQGEEGTEHPKLEHLRELVEERLGEGTKLMVFSHYRDSVEMIVEELEDVEGCRPISFVGQSGEKGMNQKAQVRVLNQFEELEYNTLVCTSVGEEGLDVPEVDAVIFYEPVASEIRSIQRKGRTGRQKAGEVIILMAKNTRDEGVYWASHHREKRMKKAMKDMDGAEQKDLRLW